MTVLAGGKPASSADKHDSQTESPVFAQYKKQLRLPDLKQFRRIQPILEGDAALNRCLGPKTHKVPNKSGVMIAFSPETVAVAEALFNENEGTVKMSKGDIMEMAAKVLILAGVDPTTSKPDAVPPTPVPPAQAEQGPTVKESDEGDSEALNPGNSQTPPTQEVKTLESVTLAAEISNENDPTSTPMSTQEHQDLERHEKTIEKGLASMVDTSLALLAIQKGKLYRKDAKTFEAYCVKRWSLAKSSAYQRIEFARTLLDLSATADIPKPTNERQARALAGLSVEQKNLVWQESIKNTSNGTPTHKDVKQARIRLGLATAESAKGTAKTENEITGATRVPSESIQTDFNAKARWQKIRDILD